MADLFQVRDQLIERLPINDQARDTIGRVADDVGRAQVIALQCLLAEKVALVQCSDELLLGPTALTDRHLDLTLGYDEERVTAGALPNDIVALLVVALLQHIADLY